MDDHLIFGLVARLCTINTLVVLRCASKIIMNYIENSELLTHLLVELCSILHVSDTSITLNFNDLFHRYNKHLLETAISVFNDVPYLLTMISDDFDDRWTRHKCQSYCDSESTKRLDEMYTFSYVTFTRCSGHRYLDIREEFEIDHITPHDIRARCARERITYSKARLTDVFPNFTKSVYYLRLYSPLVH